MKNYRKLVRNNKQVTIAKNLRFEVTVRKMLQTILKDSLQILLEVEKNDAFDVRLDG